MWILILTRSIAVELRIHQWEWRKAKETPAPSHFSSFAVVESRKWVYLSSAFLIPSSHEHRRGQLVAVVVEELAEDLRGAVDRHCLVFQHPAATGAGLENTDAVQEEGKRTHV